MAEGILVVAQTKDGGVHRMALEAVRAAQELAEATGSEVTVALPNGDEIAVEQLAGCSVSRLLRSQDRLLAQYTPGAWVGALTSLIADLDPAWIVLPHTYQSADFMARLAVRTGAGLIPEVTAFDDSGDGLVWTRPALGGKLTSRVRGKRQRMIVSVQSGAWSASDVAAGEVNVEDWPASLAGVEADREILGTEQAADDQVDLSQAEIIVAVGRGIGDEDKMSVAHDLAAALGAEVAASRPVVDNGWLPRDRQIGSSGQTVTPKLYVAMGVSGAIQHVVGMKGSQTIVAINKDAGAPIFGLADYGLVGDLHEIVPLLTEAVREAKG